MVMREIPQIRAERRKTQFLIGYVVNEDGLLPRPIVRCDVIMNEDGIDRPTFVFVACHC